MSEVGDALVNRALFSFCMNCGMYSILYPDDSSLETSLRSSLILPPSWFPLFAPPFAANKTRPGQSRPRLLSTSIRQPTNSSPPPSTHVGLIPMPTVAYQPTVLRQRHVSKQTTWR